MLDQIQVDQTYMVHFLEKILHIPSPTGFCTSVMNEIAEEAAYLGYSFEYMQNRGGVIEVPGETDGHTIGLTAHVDTLGAMVRSIKDSGMLRFTPVGGYTMNSIEGEYCQIHTRSGRSYTGTILTTHPSVHAYSDARDLKREELNMEIRLDEAVTCKGDVEKLGIFPGDFISFDPRTQAFYNGYIKSRHLDDKASVAILFGLLEMMKREGVKPVHTLKILITTYEEVGHGASFIPQDIAELIAVDMGVIGDDLSCTEREVSICAKDSTGPYDYEMVGRLIELAQKHSLQYSVDIYPHYGSDASAAVSGGNNIRAALVGPGVHASHSMERTHIDGLMNTANLLAAYILE